MTTPRYIVWDWNGTLHDDVAAAVGGINALLEERGLPLMTVESHRRHFQFPVRNYYVAAGFQLEKEDWDAMAIKFHEVFAADPSATLHRDARRVLDAFRAAGIGQSIVSACEQSILDGLIERYGIRDYFDEVCGLDNLSAASKLERGRSLVKRLQRTVATTGIWFIGDTDHDYALARDCGASCLLLSGGYQDEARLASCPCPRVPSLGD
ncbi:MAG: HAD hydrolase-like protein, partial [Kiritimatiellaeota bacterium]|nr:HAD hydrolase-like protein [Kiritimatiellota bacterium]